MFSLEQILNASYLIQKGEHVDGKLAEAAKFCYNYVRKNSDERTHSAYLKTLWQAAYWHISK
jgi:hypothetical protein